MAIPERFYKNTDKKYPVRVRTVGELVKALQELPKGLPVMQGYEKGANVTVYNVSSGSPHLELDEME